jgi:hypothetical protein
MKEWLLQAKDVVNVRYGRLADVYADWPVTYIQRVCSMLLETTILSRSHNLSRKYRNRPIADV